ncbi:Receptor homology region, transmembrane domain- and RING domain-containing protein 6 [Smittium mucronatum]|uniref:Receptor homology region, transmembrane domain-and RING domain-containing protein 6 n=1 Tax=Smittium mucronatum TaxID=133383 RepID=A0A1R0H664_9FUNG|nr:Receptor homology region, transmembrane domain- and RING domain-containing protein 6 [Smittium mucronatum]
MLHNIFKFIHGSEFVKILFGCIYLTACFYEYNTNNSKLSASKNSSSNNVNRYLDTNSSIYNFEIFGKINTFYRNCENSLPETNIEDEILAMISELFVENSGTEQILPRDIPDAEFQNKKDFEIDQKPSITVPGSETMDSSSLEYGIMVVFGIISLLYVLLWVMANYLIHDRNFETESRHVRTLLGAPNSNSETLSKNVIDNKTLDLLPILKIEISEKPTDICDFSVHSSVKEVANKILKSEGLIAETKRTEETIKHPKLSARVMKPSLYTYETTEMMASAILKNPLSLEFCFIDQLTCSICLEHYELGKSGHLRILPCGHAFHQECIDTWLLKSSSCCFCPLCKQNVYKTLNDIIDTHKISINFLSPSDDPKISTPIQKIILFPYLFYRSSIERLKEFKLVLNFNQISLCIPKNPFRVMNLNGTQTDESNTQRQIQTLTSPSPCLDNLETMHLNHIVLDMNTSLTS